MRFELLSSVSVRTAATDGCCDVDRLGMLAGISRAGVQSRRSVAVRVLSLWTITIKTLVADAWGILGFILFVSMWHLVSVRWWM